MKPEVSKIRNLGQVWTPDWVAAFMAAFILKKNPKTILDPAFGMGVFAEQINSRLNGSKMETKITAFEIDQELSPYRSENINLKYGCFISSKITSSFDAIIANPPYIRHHRLGSETKSLCRSIATKALGKTLDARAGIHTYFLIKSLSLLEKNGHLSYILPADICEGIFADTLWTWISKKFHIHSVITFNKDKVPFGAIDTNAIVFNIINEQPKEHLSWVRLNTNKKEKIIRFIQEEEQNEEIEVEKRDVEEAIKTGLSRPKRKIQIKNTISFCKIAKVMRGIATGGNEFFCFTTNKIKLSKINQKYFKRIVMKVRDVKKETLTLADLNKLDARGVDTFLLSLTGKEEISLPLRKYLEEGIKLGINDRSLVKTRNPWYKMEQRDPPDFLFSYLGRAKSKFIHNKDKIVPSTGFLCVYLKIKCNKNKLLQALNSKTVMDELIYVGKSYGNGCIKVEPRNLDKLQIPRKLLPPYCYHKDQIDEQIGQYVLKGFTDYDDNER